MISTQQKCNTSLLIGFVCIIDFGGLRTNGSTTYSYIYDGSQLSAMSVGSNQLYFSYDAFGTPQAVVYNGTQYRYITNLQGDIVEIRDANDSTVVTYTYDAWGKLLDITGTKANDLGVHNPLRYRGYTYDTETGLYCLQSRYYNPTIGRFISADSYASTGQCVLGNNMFAYCNNNPVVRVDATGEFFFTALGAVIGAVVGAVDSAIMGGNTEDILKGALAGAVSGAISGAGVDIGVAVTAATGGAGVGAGVAIAGALGALGSAVGTGISTDWQADPVDYAISGLVGGMTNMISFGLAPINGGIAKGAFTTITKGIIKAGFDDAAMNIATGSLIATGATWIIRTTSNDFQATYHE